MRRFLRRAAAALLALALTGAAFAEPEAVTPSDLSPATSSDLAPALFTLTGVNATLRYANERGKAEGESFDSLEVTGADSVVVTAVVPRGKRLDYWVLNGVRYEFSSVVTSLRMTNFDRSWTVEAVLRRTDPETLRSEEEIQAERTFDPPRVVRVTGGELCHLKSGSVGGGGWIDSFDFTYDYENRATGAETPGGQVSCKVRATVPRGGRVIGWRFGGTELYPGTRFHSFVVHGLDTAMVYEPILLDTSTPTPPPPTATPVPTVRVVCKGCVFSGGGYTDATAGEVVVGTEITVRSGYPVQTWSVNGAILLAEDGGWDESPVIVRTVSADTTVVCAHELKTGK